MSLHIAAKEGEIAEVVLLPGDPLRAKHIAETFLENPKQYTSIRNIFGYTGTYKGKKVSVQATGMGVPSISIYTHELITQYGVKKLIRVGTCGGMHEDVKIRDIVIAQGATTDSGIVRQIFGNVNFAGGAVTNVSGSKSITGISEIKSETITSIGNVHNTDGFKSITIKPEPETANTLLTNSLIDSRGGSKTIGVEYDYSAKYATDTIIKTDIFTGASVSVKKNYIIKEDK